MPDLKFEPDKWFGKFISADIGNWYTFGALHAVDDSVDPPRFINDAWEDSILFHAPMYISKTTTSTSETVVFEAEIYSKLEGNYINNCKVFELVLYPFACPLVSGETARITKLEFEVYSRESKKEIHKGVIQINEDATLEEVPDIIPVVYYKQFSPPKDIGKTFTIYGKVRLYGYSVGGGECEFGLHQLPGWRFGVLRVRGGRT